MRQRKVTTKTREPKSRTRQSGKDAERKKVQGGVNNGRPVKLANLNRDAYSVIISLFCFISSL